MAEYIGAVIRVAQTSRRLVIRILIAIMSFQSGVYACNGYHFSRCRTYFFNPVPAVIVWRKLSCSASRSPAGLPFDMLVDPCNH